MAVRQVANKELFFALARMRQAGPAPAIAGLQSLQNDRTRKTVSRSSGGITRQAFQSGEDSKRKSCSCPRNSAVDRPIAAANGEGLRCDRALGGVLSGPVILA